MNNNQIEEFFIWDEKSCTEHQTKSENKTENGMNATIPETKKESNKKSLKDTIKNEWKRNCPSCNIELKYKKKQIFDVCIQRNSVCLKCSAIKRTQKFGWNFSTIRNCPSCNNVIKYKSPGNRTIAEKKKSVCRKCKHELHKEKILLNLKDKHTLANYNPKACEYFDKLNLENDWKLQHALNGGEIKVLNYFIDAYDKEKNIVVEYDEKYHYSRNGKLKEKDILRQQRIVEYLKCRFFRYNEKTCILTEINKDPTPD